MTQTAARPRIENAGDLHPGHLLLPSGQAARRRTGLPVVGVLFAAAALIGLLAPDATQGSSSMDGMSMTHYMGLLSLNQPWNLLVFMALPVVLAETLAITELTVLFSARTPAWVHRLNRMAGLLAGPVMLGILLHLTIHAVVPLTANGDWAGWIDILAVLAYLAGAIPMIAISLVHAGVLGASDREARKILVIAVAAFLIVAHVAMIAGMLDPGVTGWTPPAEQPAPTHQMPDGATMPGHHH